MRVLFIGNSFTVRNDLPGMVAGLAAGDGKSLESRVIWAGGASLRMHWNKGEAQQAIADGGYDFVVLQEQSTLPIKNATRFHENVRLFDAAIKEAGARTALYMTWARKHEPENQQVLNEAYRAIGEELGAPVVPVGERWERCLGAPGCPPLHDADGSHPSLAGSYLAACVFYRTLFAGSPEGSGYHPDGLSAETVAFLRHCSRE
jgi:hypothetical protein